MGGCDGSSPRLSQHACSQAAGRAVTCAFCPCSLFLHRVTRRKCKFGPPAQYKDTWRRSGGWWSTERATRGLRAAGCAQLPLVASSWGSASRSVCMCGVCHSAHLMYHYQEKCRLPNVFGGLSTSLHSARGASQHHRMLFTDAGCEPSVEINK